MLVSMECKKQKKNKISASLPRAMTKALGKEGSFAEGPSNSPRQRIFWKKILTISLPRARKQALGKGLKNSKNQFLCRGPALGKGFLKNPENLFAEGQRGGPRQRLKKIKKIICRLCRGPALGKEFLKNPENFFTEGQGGF